MLQDYFTNGTQGTVTGRQIGLEIETDFVTADGSPITGAVTDKILAAKNFSPEGCETMYETGVQKIELAIAPQTSIAELIAKAHESLEWLYAEAAQYGAHPLLAPEIVTDEKLVLETEDRNNLWIELDGTDALEELCRCSSVQYTMDVNPKDAIEVINRLWSANLHQRDYAPNDARWTAYIAKSKANYLKDRYAGPAGFESMADYTQKLAANDVVMHEGRTVRLKPEETPNLDIDLFLRSVWWHYRLRRFGNTLAVEMRPFARRADSDFAALWSDIAETLQLSAAAA